MPTRTPVAPDLIRTIAHPVRLRIVGALDQRPMTLAEVAGEIGVDRRSATRHLRLMQRVGLVRSVDGPDGAVYEAVTGPTFSDGANGALPVAMRRAGAAVALANIQATVTSALSDGGFDRGDVHLTRTTLTIDAEGWQRVADELAEALERIDAVGEEVAHRPSGSASSARATAVLMLYGHDADEPLQAPSQPSTFSREDALLRAWDLNEDLADLLVPDEATDWAAIVDRVDQLRVVASAALATEREGRRHPEQPAPSAASL
jgi:DNA-binding transcriptional ArsR family regulator